MAEFRLKSIDFRGSSVSILCQNENGPCPLLAIANALILRQQLSFHPDIRSVTLNELIEQVANKVFELNKVSENESVAAQQSQQFQSVMTLIPLLQRGLDINVKFNDVNSFEYTQAFDVFDTFGISLYHGWVVDPQAEDLARAVKGLSYNELTTKVAEHRARSEAPIGEAEGEGEEERLEGHLLDSFLEETASQLTFYGLLRLYEVVKEGEIAVFFRNDHFSTLLRHENKLYSLVTDLGYEYNEAIVWELLDTIDGATDFVNAYFGKQPPLNDILYSTEGNAVLPSGEEGRTASTSADYLLAMQLSREAEPPDPDRFNFTTTTVKRPSVSSTGSVKSNAARMKSTSSSAKPFSNLFSGSVKKSSQQSPHDNKSACTLS